MVKNNISIKKAKKLLQLKKVSINDYDEIKKRALDYLEWCENEDRIPTVRGLCLALGVAPSTISNWSAEKPNHRTVLLIEQIKNIMADGLEQGALKGTLNAKVSTFLLKSNFDYRENKEVHIHHIGGDVKSIEQIEKEIENEIIDVDFIEKN